MAVPAVGAWLATRRDGPRVSLGLAVIAVWGAVYHLAPQLALLVANVPGVHVGAAPAPLTYVLGTGACVAAVVALRCHTGPGWMPAASRTAVAAAAVVWAVAAVAAPIAKQAFSSQQVVGGAWLSAGEVTWLLVLLVIAAVVWRGDSLTAVGAAAVVSLGALVDVLSSALAAFRPEPPPVQVLSAGVDGATVIALLVQAVAAAVLIVATTHLALRWRATS